MVWVLAAPDNEGQNKHVESTDVPCLDEGSNPSSSTNRIRRVSDKEAATRLLFCYIQQKEKLVWISAVQNKKKCAFAILIRNFSDSIRRQRGHEA